jgi:acyl carrier protein
MNKFATIVGKFFNIPPEDVRDELTPQDIPDWDSMNYLLFIAEVEKEYDISLTMDEVMQAKTLGDVRKCLTSRGITP